MRLFAWDTETYLIAARDGLQQNKSTINTSSYVTPKVVLGSFCTSGGAREVVPPLVLAELLRANLRNADTHLLCHNFSFDCDVMCTAFPDLWPLFEKAMNEGRCHDTKVLDMRYGLARGYFDTPNPDKNWAYPDVRGRSLKALAEVYLNKAISKDLVDDAGDLVRLSFHKWDGVPIADIPRIYRDYALEDAVTTLEVWQAIVANAPQDLWGEPAEVRAEFAFHAMDKVGVCVDRAEAQRLHELFSRDMPGLERTLVAHGLAEWEPEAGTVTKERFEGKHATTDEPGLVGKWRVSHDGELYRWRAYANHYYLDRARAKFHMRQAALREALLLLATGRGIDYKKTETGLLSLVADDWHDKIPADHEALQAWLQYKRLEKILSTYLTLYSRVDQVFPRMYSTGACTGRTSSSAPNIQNVSKNTHGIRSLFVPHEGFVFLKADYSFMELVTLAQVMLDLGIKGPLFDAIQSGDPHTSTAALLMGVDPSKIGKKSPERQAAKAVNFGCPGGLGAAKLGDYARKNYKVIWTLDEARSIRSRFLAVYPDIVAYLERHKTRLDEGLTRVSGRGIRFWMGKLGCYSIPALRTRLTTTEDTGLRRMFYEAERCLTVNTRGGLVRAKTAFTEGSNTRFQGTAADVAKEALWRTHCACVAAGHGARPVLMVHDEIVVETPLDFAEESRTILESSMLSAFTAICPDTGPFAKVEIDGPLSQWGKATDKDGKEIA